MWTKSLKQLKLNFSLMQLSRNYVSSYKRPATILLKENQISLLSETLSKNDLTFQDFKILRSEVVNSDRNINEVNVDSCIVGSCYKDFKLDNAKLYLSFLKEQEINVNFATLGKLLKLYYLCFVNGKVDSTEVEDEVLNIINGLTEKHSILDASTAENAIFAICITSQWKQSLKFLDMIKITCNPNSSTYSVIISTAFKFHDFEIGWKLLNELVHHQRVPRNEVYTSWFQNCPRKIEEYERMLSFLGNNNLTLPTSVGVEVVRAFNELGYVGKFSKINKAGKCNCCLTHLKINILDESEFKRLSDKFLHNVLIRNDVYLKSNPDEVKRFKEFVEITAPYDCVIDGLNVAYSTGNQKSPAVYARNLATVVKYFAEANKKILVLGRKHMARWPKEQMNFIKRKSLIFLTENISEDDPFLLYAALRSGPKTDFFSRDLMRSHSFLLDDDEKNIFLRWQLMHQYSLIHAINEKGKIIVKKPIKFQINVHKNDQSCWHIPLELEEDKSTTCTSKFDIPSSWLCISKFQN